MYQVIAVCIYKWLNLVDRQFSAWAVKPSCAFGTSYHQIVFFFIISTNRTPLTFVFFWGLWVFFFRCFACFSDVLQVGKVKKIGRRLSLKPSIKTGLRLKYGVLQISMWVNHVNRNCKVTGFIFWGILKSHANGIWVLPSYF